MKHTRCSVKRNLLMIALLVLLALFLLWTIIPIYIVVSNSFRKTIEMKVMPPKLIFEPIFSHYQKLLFFD